MSAAVVSRMVPVTVLPEQDGAACAKASGSGSASAASIALAGSARFMQTSSLRLVSASDGMQEASQDSQHS